MRFDRSRGTACLLSAGLVAALGALTPAALAASIDPIDPPIRGAVTDHVIVISIDGLRPDAIAEFRASNLQRLMREGSYTLAARTIDASFTLPSHTSMLTGEGPENHGITWNTNETDDHGHVAVPTVFARAHEHGFTTAAFFSKGKFDHLDVPHTLDHAELPEGDSRWSAARTVENVTEYLRTDRPNLMFVHIGEPDYAGHTFTWMSTFYGRAVRRADQAVGRVLAQADRAFGRGNYTVIVTADHGGHGWGHGSADARDTTIPWIAWGKGVRGGTRLGAGIRTMDTATTAAWLLGLDALGVGEPVVTAFGEIEDLPTIVGAGLGSIAE